MKKKHKKVIIRSMDKRTTDGPWVETWWRCTFSLYVKPDVIKVITIDADEIKSDAVLGAYKYFCEYFKKRGLSVVTPDM